MELRISPFGAISEKEQIAIINLIKIGNEANADLILERLENSLFTACLHQENRIVGTATIKRPELPYRTYVFDQAGLTYPLENFTLELGYIFIENEFRNQGLALSICRALISLIPKETIFATTRIDNRGMQSILQQLYFTAEGRAYKNRSKTKLLQFYLRNNFLN
jgi:RimJ/RimL family protein N-acetyltransferase